MRGSIVVAVLFGCSAKPDPVAIRPLVLGVLFGRDSIADCTTTPGRWTEYSKTKIAPLSQEPIKQTCVVPALDGQRFMLHSITCSKISGESARLQLTIDGESLDLMMTAATPTVNLSFGAGLATDGLTGYMPPKQYTEGKCLIAGYYVSKDSPSTRRQW